MASAGVGVALVPATAQGGADSHAPTVRRSVADLTPRLVALTTRRGTSPNRAVASIAKIIIGTARDAAQSMAGCHVRPDTDSGGDVLSMTQ